MYDSRQYDSTFFLVNIGEVKVYNNFVTAFNYVMSTNVGSGFTFTDDKNPFEVSDILPCV